MALPTLTKTWQFQVNYQNTVLGTQALTGARALRTLKDAFLGSGAWTGSNGSATTSTNNWTVLGSSNASAGAMDGVDRWTADGNVLWNTNGSAHSWIVLKQTALASNFQLLLNLNSASSSPGQNRIDIYISPNAGFTGGTFSARPTATDEIAIAVGANSGLNVSENQRIHVMKSSDGECTRVLWCRSGWPTGLWLIEKFNNPISGLTYPILVNALGTGTSGITSNQITTTSVLSQTNGIGVVKGLTTNIAAFASGEMTRAGNLLLTDRLAQQNDLSGAYPLMPVGAFCNTASNRGRLGTFFDLWWGIPTLAEATTYPNDGTKQMVQTGGIVLPWDRSLPAFS